MSLLLPASLTDHPLNMYQEKERRLQGLELVLNPRLYRASDREDIVHTHLCGRESNVKNEVTFRRFSGSVQVTYFPISPPPTLSCYLPLSFSIPLKGCHDPLTQRQSEPSEQCNQRWLLISTSDWHPGAETRSPSSTPTRRGTHAAPATRQLLEAT